MGSTKTSENVSTDFGLMVIGSLTRVAYFGAFNMNQQLPLNAPKLCLCHAEVVPQFMYESLANLMTHFGLA